MIYEGTYPSLIQGVSQQTPQERLDGQLGAQVNMLSDPVNGLRRRTGFKLHGQLNVEPTSKFDLVQLGGEYYIQIVTPTGRLVVVRFSDMEVLYDAQYPYLVHNSKGAIRSTLSRNQCFVLNTEQVPTKVLDAVSTITPLSTAQNARRCWISIYGPLYGHPDATTYDRVRVQNSTLGIDVTVVSTMALPRTISASTRAASLLNVLQANTVLTANYTITRVGTAIALLCNTPSATSTITITSLRGSVPLSSTNASTSSMSVSRSLFPSALPSTYVGYFKIANGIKYIYDYARNYWLTESTLAENYNPKDYGWVRVLSGAFSKTYTVQLTRDTFSRTYSVTTHATTASQATPEYVATELAAAMNADSTFTAHFDVVRSSTTLAVSAKISGVQINLEALGGDTYISSSGAGVIRNTDLLPPSLPPSTLR